MNKVTFALSMALMSGAAFAKGDGMGPYDQDMSVNGVVMEFGVTGGQPQIGGQVGDDMFDSTQGKYIWRDPGSKQ